jgi:hypothetical protein
MGPGSELGQAVREEEGWLAGGDWASDLRLDQPQDGLEAFIVILVARMKRFFLLSCLAAMAVAMAMDAPKLYDGPSFSGLYCTPLRQGIHLRQDFYVSSIATGLLICLVGEKVWLSSLDGATV